MKRLYVVLQCLLFVGIYSYSQQHFSFDSKYVKVGVMSNEWPSCLAKNPNLRNLGTLSGISFDRNRIGKQFLDSLFQRDANGLHMDRLYEEALKNTTVEEIEVALKDASAEAKDVLKRQVAHQLLKNNYIVTFRTEEKLKRNGRIKIKKYWTVYHVEIDDRIIEQAYLNWKNPSLYDRIEVPVKMVAQGKVPLKAFDENELIYDIAKKVPAFAVRGPVISRHPFVARIGNNLGVKQAARIYVYRVKENKKGEIYSTKVCSSRATDVSANSTKMLIISGAYPSLKKGDIAVLKDKHGSSLNIMGQYSPGEDYRIGGKLEYNYLVHLSKKGVAHYFQAGAEYNQFAKEPAGVWWDGDNTVQPTLYSYALTLGYGIGLPFWGRFEFVPNVNIGFQVWGASKSGCRRWDSDYETTVSYPDDWRGGAITYFGAKLYANIWYPVQLVLGADYNLSILPKKTESEDNYLNMTRITNCHHINRINFYGGLRINF